MKKISDYKGEEAIELWADLMKPILEILSDEDIVNAIKSGQPALKIAPKILKKHKKEASEILLTIDDTPLNGLNVLTRTIDVILEFMNNEEVSTFFAIAESEEKQ